MACYHTRLLPPAFVFSRPNVFHGGAQLRNSRAGPVLPPAACDILLQCSQQQQHQQHQPHEFSSKTVVIITGTSSLHGGNTALLPLLSLLSSSPSLPISGLQQLASNHEFCFPFPFCHLTRSTVLCSCMRHWRVLPMLPRPFHSRSKCSGILLRLVQLHVTFLLTLTHHSHTAHIFMYPTSHTPKHPPLTQATSHVASCTPPQRLALCQNFSKRHPPPPPACSLRP
jgi:hypothetical protein